MKRLRVAGDHLCYYAILAEHLLSIDYDNYDSRCYKHGRVVWVRVRKNGVVQLPVNQSRQ